MPTAPLLCKIKSMSKDNLGIQGVHAHTLRIGCTELKAVPLASLRNQILKNQVRGAARL